MFTDTLTHFHPVDGTPIPAMPAPSVYRERRMPRHPDVDDGDILCPNYPKPQLSGGAAALIEVQV